MAHIWSRYPLNAPGDFYVVEGQCISCRAPEAEAPDLMSHDPEADCEGHCYFKKRPSTSEELDRAIWAVAVGCCGAVRYGGRDEMILERLKKWNSDACDAVAEYK